MNSVSLLYTLNCHKHIHHTYTQGNLNLIYCKIRLTYCSSLLCLVVKWVWIFLCVLMGIYKCIDAGEYPSFHVWEKRDTDMERRRWERTQCYLFWIGSTDVESFHIRCPMKGIRSNDTSVILSIPSVQFFFSLVAISSGRNQGILTNGWFKFWDLESSG